MTEKNAIEVAGVSKSYRAVSSSFARFLEMLRPGMTRGSREFVALAESSFKVEAGTSLGVIGPNGAGKSTLLKLLAGILEPTTGHIKIHGKLSSIIELGSGFHPDFTGMENVKINASLMNVSNAELAGIIADIEAFTQLGKYLHMPVKTYSSGMFVRLAFAFAVSVKPDVLLVDEALAVGDAVFSHKCLARIRKLKDEGVTVVFVSHDTGMISQICDRCILIDHGQMIADGTPKEVIHQYLQNVAEELTVQKLATTGGELSRKFHQVGASEGKSTSLEQRFGNFDAIITDIFAVNELDECATRFVSGDRVQFKMYVKFTKDISSPIFGVMLKNRFGVEIYGTNTDLKKTPIGAQKEGDTLEISFDLPVMLGGGTYAASFAVHSKDGQYFDYRVDALVFEVVQSKDCGGQLNLPVSMTCVPVDSGLLTPVNKGDIVYSDAPHDLNPTLPEHEKFLEGQWFENIAHNKKSGRWVGDTANLYLKIDTQCGQSLALTLCSLKPDVFKRPTTVAVYLNDELLGTVSVNGSAWQTLCLNIPVPEQSYIGRITLTAETWSPKDYGSSDDRRLSILIHKVAIN